MNYNCFFRGISSCDKCEKNIIGLTKKYAEGSEELIKTLKGDTFCESRLLNLGSEEKMKECQDFLEIYIPNVLLSISEKVAEDSQLLCYDLFDEICPLDADLVSYSNNFMVIEFQASKNVFVLLQLVIAMYRAKPTVHLHKVCFIKMDTLYIGYHLYKGCPFL